MIDNALRAASTWDSKLSLAMYLPPIQFRSDGLAIEICDHARRWRVAFDRLELEVTESSILLGFQRDNVLATLGELGKCGAKVVMDDFGIGYSSLSNLKEFTFDKIKIERGRRLERASMKSPSLTERTPRTAQTIDLPNHPQPVRDRPSSQSLE